MNPRNAIEVKNLFKEYRLYRRAIHRLRETLFPYLPKKSQKFVANCDISFSIPKSQCVGILGKNGSGKSTLLKIITGIVTPTSGSVEVNGRISALLELGAGFNPELTGIENVEAVCGMMGLSASETKMVLPKVIEFSEIGDHITQPVKTYSSGMFVRLAFSVSIVVNPDILIVDEALSVGDARFQRKCFRKMREFKDSGKTILFVSHDLDQIKEFCDHAILLDEGKVIDQGKPAEVIMNYFDLMFPKQSAEHDKDSERSGPIMALGEAGQEWITIGNEDRFKEGSFGVGGAWLTRLRMSGLSPEHALSGGKVVKIQASYSWNQSAIKSQIDKDFYAADMSVGIALADVRGNYVFGCNTIDNRMRVDPFASSSAVVEFSLVLPHLKTGTYFLTVTLALGTQDHHIQMNWYDALAQIKCESGKKNTYGFMALDYVTERLDVASTSASSEQMP